MDNYFIGVSDNLVLIIDITPYREALDNVINKVNTYDFITFTKSLGGYKSTKDVLFLSEDSDCHHLMLQNMKEFKFLFDPVSYQKHIQTISNKGVFTLKEYYQRLIDKTLTQLLKD